MIRESVQRFSEKIMLNQKARAGWDRIESQGIPKSGEA
jgi:hypothetical protein